MKQNKLFFGLATMFAAAFTFTACTSDDAESQSAQQDRTIRLTSSVERGSTRATTDPQSSTSLSTNSNLAIWAINTTADPDAALTNGNNEQYSVDGSGNLTPKTAANTMTWPDGATLDFYAYAPYNSGYSYNAANSFSVQTDQSTEANYLASDLVLAQATSKTYDANTPVALPFKHLLSKINISINLLTGSNVSLDDASVTITNTKIATTFTPNAAENAILGEASGGATNITAVADLNGASTACAVLVPQTISAGTELVKIIAGTKTLIAKLGTNTTLESGKSYSFTVNVGTVDDDTPAVVTVVLGQASVTEWDSENNTLGAVYFPRWYAEFGTPQTNGTYNSESFTYTWTNGSSNLMNCFTFNHGELTNYTTLTFKIGEITTGTGTPAVRINLLFNDDKNMNTNSGYYTGNKTNTINLSDLNLTVGEVAHSLSDVKAIRFGGSNGANCSVIIKASDMYLE